jgi:hypothetical protein
LGRKNGKTIFFKKKGEIFLRFLKKPARKFPSSGISTWGSGFPQDDRVRESDHWAMMTASYQRGFGGEGMEQLNTEKWGVR